MQPYENVTMEKEVVIPSQPASVVSVATPGMATRSLPSLSGAVLPVWLWPVFVGLSLLGFPSGNPSLTFIGILVVPLLVSLLWRPGETPILLACCLMQWLQVMTPVFHADLFGEPLESMSQVPMHEQATWLSLIGVVSVAVGMRLALKHRLGSIAPQMEQELGALNLSRVFMAFLASVALSSVCGALAWRLGGLTQLILAVGSLKWAMLWILIAAAVVQGRGYGFVVAALVLEAGVGLLGFFATFKEVFFMLGIAIFSVRQKLSGTLRIGFGVTTVGMICLMIYWQAVKIEYRAFLNQGSGDQAVVVSVEERIEKLQRMLEALDLAAIEKGLETLVERVGYTELFAATLQWVPANEPFAEGELWTGAVLHPLMPRLLFPNKAEINDSERARRFTGQTLSGSEEGSSIGIGYMAESYADFGEMFMFAPIFLLGYVLGRLYRGLSYSGISRMWGTAVAVAALFMTLQALATTGAKLFGAVLSSSLVMLLLNRFADRKIQALLGSPKSFARVSATGRER